MADVWISTGRRFCEICKCWFGNNKLSQEHHDRGEKHKAALAARIRESTMKQAKKEAAAVRLNGALAKMEAAAAAAMAANGEGIVHGPDLPTTGLKMNIFDPKQFKDVSSMAREMASRKEGNIKRKGLSGAAPPPSEGPSMKVTKQDVVSAYRDLTKPTAGPALPESHAVAYMPETQTQNTEISWVQAKAEDGSVYYWNLFDKSTRWEKPAHFYTPAQYQQKVNEFEEARKNNYYGTDEIRAVRQGKKNLEQYIRDKVQESGFDTQVAVNRKELNLDKPKKERRRRWDKQAETEESIKQEETGGEEFPEDIDDIPLPDIPMPEEAPVDEDDGEPETSQPYIEEEEAEPEDVKQEPMEEEEAPVQQMATNAGPYGGWVRITKEEKSNETFESPLTARYKEMEEQNKKEVEERLKAEAAEPKIVFEEKVAAVSTKKVKGPIEFKKKSTTRNIRKREE